MQDVDPDLIIRILPPTWLEAVHAWAPYVLAVLVAATVLVRVTLPLAKKLEAWALSTPAGWDDAPSRYLVRALEGFAGVSTIMLSFIPRLTVGVPPPKPGEDPPIRRTRPPAAPLAMLCLALLVSACGSELDIHAAIARSALETQIATEPMIRDLRVAAMTGAVERVHTAGGSREEAEAAAAAESTRWQCAIDGHRLLGSTTAIYVRAVLDGQAGEDFSLTLVLPYVRRLVDAYRVTASCVNSLGGQLPVPDFLDLLPPAWAITGGVS